MTACRRDVRFTPESYLDVCGLDSATGQGGTRNRPRGVTGRTLGVRSCQIDRMELQRAELLCRTTFIAIASCQSAVAHLAGRLNTTVGSGGPGRELKCSVLGSMRTLLARRPTMPTTSPRGD